MAGQRWSGRAGASGRADDWAQTVAGQRQLSKQEELPGAAARTEAAGRAGKADRAVLEAGWAVQEVTEDARVEAHFGVL